MIELFEVADNRHSGLILGMVAQVLADSGVVLNQCDAIAFGRGPGSFTGLRIGVGVVQGLAYGADIPVVPVSSLRVQAARVRAANVLAAFDARMGQLYWGRYRMNGGRVEPDMKDIMLTAPERVSVPPEDLWTAVGTGCDLCREVIESANPDSKIRFVQRSYPHAMDVARLGVLDFQAGEMIPAAQAVPEYIRNQVTTRK